MSNDVVKDANDLEKKYLDLTKRLNIVTPKIEKLQNERTLLAGQIEQILSDSGVKSKEELEKRIEDMVLEMNDAISDLEIKISGAEKIVKSIEDRRLAESTENEV